MEEIKSKANYCLNCVTKPCSNKGCPLNNNIPGFIKAIKEENYKQAYEILSETTVLESVCGRICPHTKQCQGSCVRGIKGQPVSIGELEAFVGDIAIKEGYNVIGLPGATAFVPALIMSGINPNKFLFYGFLDSKKSSKKKELEELKQEKYTLIFYESPYRVRETLELIYEIFGDRSVSVSREISKKYEEVYRGKINEVLEELIEPKGEFVIIVEGNTKKETYDDIDILSHVKKLIDEGYTEKEAIKKVAKLHNLEKNIVYMEYHGGK